MKIKAPNWNMGIFSKIPASILCFAFLLAEGGATVAAEPVKKSHPRTTVPFHDINSWNGPAIVLLNDEQTSYVSEVLLTMMRVMAESSSLEAEEEKILGSGRFRWPKNPDEPVKPLK